MPQRSAVTLLGILQRHGLTTELLERWVHFCEQRDNGEVSLHAVDGQFKSYAVHVTGRLDALRREGLTKVTHERREERLTHT